MKTILSLAVFFLLIGAVRAQDDRFWFDVKINGKPARLMFDTGAEMNGLYPRAVKRLGLETDVPVPNGPAENGKVGVGVTKLAELKAAENLLSTRFAIYPRDLSSYDIQHDGIVAWPAIHDNVWLIEATTHTLKSVGRVAKDAATWTRFRILTNRNILALEVPGPRKSKLVVAIDTGKSGGVTLSPQRWQQWKAAHPRGPKSLVSYYMFGAGNTLKEESWADEIALGSLVLTDVPVMEANIVEVVAGSTNFAATLGMAALKRLDVVVDGKNNFAYVRPKRTPPAAYVHNRLGAVFIDQRAQGSEFLAHVAPGSPAEEAGIRDGDMLLKVGEQDVVMIIKDPTLAPLIFDWDRPAGTKFILTLMRGSDVFKKTVELRDILKPKRTLKAPAKDLASEVKWLMELGDSAYQETNYDQAISNYTEIIRIKPDTADAFNGRGAAYFAKGSKALALADFSEAIRLEPGMAKAFNNRGNVWQDGAKAIADYNEALRLEPDDAEFHHNRGISLALNGEPEKAMDVFNKAIKLNPNFAGAYLDRGIGHQNKGEYDRAYSDFSEAIRLKPDFIRALKARGALLLLTNNFEGAISDLSAAIRLNSADAEALNNRGGAYRHTGAFDLAIADLTEAMRLSPSNAMVLYNRGYAWSGKKDYDKAIADFTRVIELDAKYFGAFVGRAADYYAINDYAKAVADYDVLARVEPNNAGVFNNRGLSFEAAGKYDEAIADYTKAIRLNPSFVAAIGFRGDAYRKKKDYAHAISDYEHALKLDPDNPERLCMLAQVLAISPDDSLRDGKRAVQYALKACELTSWKDAKAVDILAMAHAANGNFSEAVKWEETFLRVDGLPENVRASAQERLKLYQEKKPYRDTE